MIKNWQETEKKAEHFYELYITNEEIINCGENEGRKVVLEIGNQYEKEYGGSCIDFITTSDLEWISPNIRFKIIMCADTAKALKEHLELALSYI